MFRILGNSPERVQVPDLGDSIFYKQTKEYTDQEYEKSKDLKRAVAQGRLTILENIPSMRGSSDNGNGNGNGSVNIHQSGISKSDLKDAIREALSEGKSAGISANDMAGAVREMAPLIIDTIRQEVSSKLSGMSFGDNVKKTTSSTFVGPEYVPDINIESMVVGNIKTEEKNVSGSDMESALAALRNMNNK